MHCMSFWWDSPPALYFMSNRERPSAFAVEAILRARFPEADTSKNFKILGEAHSTVDERGELFNAVA